MFRSYEDQNAAIINGDWKLIKYRSGKVQLYNISNDESETTNLINVYPERTKDMLERLNKWIEEATPKELLYHKKILEPFTTSIALNIGNICYYHR